MASRSVLLDDYCFGALDDFNVRHYLLAALRDPARRAELIEEHRNRPIYRGTRPGGPPELDSPELGRLLDKLRVVPQANKHCIVETVPWTEYRIGILPGKRGEAVEVTDETYKTRDEAEHAIFLKRLDALLDQYDIKS